MLFQFDLFQVHLHEARYKPLQLAKLENNGITWTTVTPMDKRRNG